MKMGIHTKTSGILILIGLFLIGCNSNKDSDTPPPVVDPYVNYYNSGYGNGNFYGNGANCPLTSGVGNQILTAPAQTTSSNMGIEGFTMNFCLSLIGDANLVAQWQASGRAPSYYYRGALAVTGSLNLSNRAVMGSCVVPAGSYTLNTLTQGTYDPVTFTVPQLEATNGSVRIVFQITNGWTRDPNMDYIVDRLSLKLFALSVGMNGAMQSCGDYQGLFLN